MLYLGTGRLGTEVSGPDSFVICHFLFSGLLGAEIAGGEWTSHRYKLVYIHWLGESRMEYIRRVRLRHGTLQTSHPIFPPYYHLLITKARPGTWVCIFTLTSTPFLFKVLCLHPSLPLEIIFTHQQPCSPSAHSPSQPPSSPSSPPFSAHLSLLHKGISLKAVRWILASLGAPKE